MQLSIDRSRQGPFRPRFLALLAGGLLLALAGACGPPPESDPVESTTHEVKGGTLTFDRPEVGLLPRCSGTLITDRHVLTAAHCVDYSGWKIAGEHDNFSIDKQTAGGAINGRRPQTHPFPIKRTVSIGEGWTGPRDLAIVQLNASVPATIARPAAFASAPARVGDQVTMVGYGGDGQKRFRTYNFTERDLVGDYGDSGGAIFLGGLTGGTPLVQVVSTTNWDPIVGSRDINAEPVAAREEIFRLIEALDTPDICYRVFNGGTRGWSLPRCQGTGATSPSVRDGMYAFQAWSNRPGVQICYRVFAAKAPLDDGRWGPEVCDGLVAGTPVHLSPTIRMIEVRLRSAGRLLVRGANQNGWMPSELEAAGGLAVGEPKLNLTGIALRLP